MFLQFGSSYILSSLNVLTRTSFYVHFLDVLLSLSEGGAGFDEDRQKGLFFSPLCLSSTNSYLIKHDRRKDIFISCYLSKTPISPAKVNQVT